MTLFVIRDGNRFVMVFVDGTASHVSSPWCFGDGDYDWQSPAKLIGGQIEKFTGHHWSKMHIIVSSVTSGDFDAVIENIVEGQLKDYYLTEDLVASVVPSGWDSVEA